MVLQPGHIRALQIVIIIIIITIIINIKNNDKAPYLTNKDEHIALYKINTKCIHTIQPYTILILLAATYVCA